MPKPDLSLLCAALVGYQAEAARITAEIADLKKRLGMHGGGGLPGPFAKEAAPAKRRLSAAARKRITAAQRKRWAEFHKQQKGK